MATPIADEGLAHIREEPTTEQRENARKSHLYNRGDMTLVWVNEGDLHPFPTTPINSEGPGQ